ncbi:hypothetical protein CHS0354_029773 [Potamilus streckersoni]|uniref:F-box domain-containing protein n=1 Tax=Potamilus streckersoni TaxID=2493646 RepID=A0AAE0WE66_9BIVA|nr:hypothetical protein CHS0354_029773 [Potamilus streckersoni]
MSERSLRYIKKSDFGGMRSRRGKRKPNQLYVFDITTQWLDFPRGPHFNKLPGQLILEIFKYLSVCELLRKVSLVCKYWYNLCRDRNLWTSLTWNGTQKTLGYLLQLTKYQVHELVLTNLRNSSDNALSCLLKKCMHLKCLKLPKRACRELFERELPRTKIFGENQGADFFVMDHDRLPSDLYFEYSRRRIGNCRLSRNHLFENVIHPRTLSDYLRFFLCDVPDSVRASLHEEEIDIALVKRFLTLEEYLEKHIKACVSQPLDKDYLMELEGLYCLLQRRCDDRSTRRYERTTKTTRHSCFRKLSFQDCRTDRRQHQPSKRKPRPPKGRINHHKEVRKFRRLQKRFKVFSLR